MNRTYWTGFLSGTTIVALGMVAVLAGSGFQGANQKIGVIDSGPATSLFRPRWSDATGRPVVLVDVGGWVYEQANLLLAAGDRASVFDVRPA